MSTEESTKPCAECGEFMEFDPETEQTKCPACNLVDLLQTPPDTISVSLNSPIIETNEISIEDSIYSLPQIENPHYALHRLAGIAEEIACPIHPNRFYDKPVLVSFAHHVLNGTGDFAKHIMEDAFLAVFARAVMVLKGKV